MRNRGKGGSRHVGRTRIEAAKLLTMYTDLDVRPEDIKPATGRYRTDWRQDTYRWEVFTRTKSGMVWVGGSWQRLGDFVRECKREKACHYDSDCELYSGPIRQKNSNRLEKNIRAG